MTGDSHWQFLSTEPGPLHEEPWRFADLTGKNLEIRFPQNLDMSPGDRQSTFEQPGKPTRGMSQERVQANFGAPLSTREPIGDPPITRWEYADFVVFFEYDKVIHAVTKR